MARASVRCSTGHQLQLRQAQEIQTFEAQSTPTTGTSEQVSSDPPRDRLQLEVAPSPASSSFTGGSGSEVATLLGTGRMETSRTAQRNALENRQALLKAQQQLAEEISARSEMQQQLTEALAEAWQQLSAVQRQLHNAQTELDEKEGALGFRF